MRELLPVRAKKKALHLLERMDRTEQQLYRKLADGGYPDQVAKEAVDYVKSYHYIDDVRYARSYIESRKAAKSLRQIERELYQKGITTAIIVITTGTGAPPYSIFIVRKQHFNFILFW